MLKTKTKTKNKTQIQTQTQVHLFINHIEQMDIEKIQQLLDSSITYQDMNKSDFVWKLSEVFQKFLEAGDSFLVSQPGMCNSCYRGNKGLTFKGNLSFNYISIIIEHENGTITDIYECNRFKNEKEKQCLNNKIDLDNNFTNIFDDIFDM